MRAADDDADREVRSRFRRQHTTPAENATFRSRVRARPSRTPLARWEGTRNKIASATKAELPKSATPAAFAFGSSCPS